MFSILDLKLVLKAKPNLAKSKANFQDTSQRQAEPLATHVVARLRCAVITSSISKSQKYRKRLCTRNLMKNQNEISLDQDQPRACLRLKVDFILWIGKLLRRMYFQVTEPVISTPNGHRSTRSSWCRPSLQCLIAMMELRQVATDRHLATLLLVARPTFWVLDGSSKKS